MSAFIHGTKTVDISGGNFRQTSYNEQHEHHTRVSREDKTIIRGNIYGYTHTAISDDGPIIAYSHTTNITRPQYDETSSRSFLSHPTGEILSWPQNKPQFLHSVKGRLPIDDTPRMWYKNSSNHLTLLPVRLGDDTEHRSHDRDMTGKFLFFRRFCLMKELEAS